MDDFSAVNGGGAASDNNGGQNVRRHIFTLPPHPHVDLDEDRFLTLLEGSFSLSIEEKKRVVDSVPQLTMDQIRELEAIFEQELEKFVQLRAQYPQQVEKLESKRKKEVEIQYLENEEQASASADEEEAAAIRARLGL